MNTISEIQKLIEASNDILIVQADNPDADSLGSALALEQILTEQGKQTHLYCGVTTPSYLHYLGGWSRVESKLPKTFDLTIIVDASTMTLLEKLQQNNGFERIAKKPVIVIDHHAAVQDTVEADVTINKPEASSTGEVIYNICTELNWAVSSDAGEPILAAILGDTQGLSNNLTYPHTYRVVADLVESGVDRASLEEKRRAHNKFHESIYRYKASLINKTELHDRNRIACVVVPQTDINSYSPLYNPAALIHGDMLQVDQVLVGIVFKTYDDGKITAAIRCNPGGGIAADLAMFFGGGGHKFASGFKITDSRPFNEIKSECLKKATELLQNQ